jgi:anti-anti-sigma factor
MSIKIRKKTFGKHLVLVVTGKVGSQDTLAISKRISGLAGKQFDKMVIDLSAVAYIDSRWLGVFVYSWKLLRERGKELVFLIPPGFIRNLFQASNLGLAFKIIDSLEALESTPAQPDNAGS